MLRRNLGFALASMLLLAPQAAWAMAAPPCAPVKLLPTSPTVPANLPAFGFTALPNAGTPPMAHLYSTSGGNRVEVAVTVATPVDGFVKVTPNAALVAGTSYELEYTGTTCPYGSPPVAPYKFTASASAPLPTKVGTLQGTPTVTTKDLGTTQFTIDATYAIDPEMKPWVSVYELLLVLDGKLVGSKVALTGTDTAKINATGWCDATTAAANPHQLLLRARLPFSPNLESASAPLTFNCPAPTLKTPGGAPPSTAGTTTATPTATTTATPSADGGTNNATGGGGSSSSCSAAHNPTSTSSWSLVVLAAVAAGLTRRRAAARRT